MILYRPVGLQEMALVYDSGMQAFPARLSQQPIFYPVLDLEYARQTASDWNARNGQFAGYVTEFKVEDEYIGRFEKHAVGGSRHQELWIPAEELEDFNGHITGHIKVLEAHFGDAFQGFIPEQFGLQGKNAVEQFNLLANSYLYKRMEFYLEVKRNHKAVFLNYPFWQIYEFKNPGLKEKILQAIKEAWLASFPKIPLPNPAQEDATPVKQAQAHTQHLVDPVEEAGGPVEQTDSHSWVEPVDEDITPVEQTETDAPVNPIDEHITPEKQTGSPFPLSPARGEITHYRQTDSHFVQGIKLGLSGEYHDAIAELSRAAEEDPDHAVIHASLGVAFHRLGEDDHALACYETALKIDPIYAEAHYFRANILYSRGRIREAIAGYTLAIGLKPELIEAHHKTGPQDRLTDYTGSPAEMYWIEKPAHRILELDKFLESNSGQAHLFKERAAEYYRLRNYAKAIADYSSSLALQPDDGDVLHLRGVAYEQLGQSDRALADYQQAIALNPQLSDIYIDRGVTFGKMGSFGQAITSLTEAIRLAPGNPDAYFNRGVMYFEEGDFEKAISDFSMVIQLSSNDEDAYYWRGMSNEEAGRKQDARVDYRRFLAISQNSQAREQVEQKLRQWDEGRQNSRSSRRSVPDDSLTGKTNQVTPETARQHLDLYGLVAALGERALHSTWFGSGLDCYGENAEELYTLTNQDSPIEGSDLLAIASGIRQTVAGDFQAFDPGTNSPWIFIRAWEGSGFYIETDDPKSRERLKNHFQSVEEVDGAAPPYEGLFIRI